MGAIKTVVWPENLISWVLTPEKYEGKNLTNLLEAGEISPHTEDTLRGVAYAMSKLSPRKEVVLTEYFRDGRNIESISRGLNVSQTRTSSLIRDAIKDLQSHGYIEYIKYGFNMGSYLAGKSELAQTNSALSKYKSLLPQVYRNKLQIPSSSLGFTSGTLRYLSANNLSTVEDILCVKYKAGIADKYILVEIYSTMIKLGFYRNIWRDSMSAIIESLIPGSKLYRD